MHFNRLHSLRQTLFWGEKKGIWQQQWSEITNPHIYLTSADNVGFGRQQIDDFPFALVSPLRTEHHRHFVPGVVARSLLSGGGGLTHVFVVFRGPAERHVVGGLSSPVSRRLRGLRERCCHICNFIADDVRARRAAVRRGSASPGPVRATRKWPLRSARTDERGQIERVNAGFINLFYSMIWSKTTEQLNTRFTLFKIFLTLKGLQSICFFCFF